MDLYDSILSSLPSNTFRLNSAGSAFVDALNRGTALSGTQLLTNSIVTGNAKSITAKNTNALSFDTLAYSNKSHQAPFSLEAWFQPRYFGTGSISILSHNGEYDGLWATVDDINFSVAFSGGTAKVSWAIPDSSGTYHIVGVYTPSKISLFVNGVVVAESDVDTLSSQGFKTFSSNSLYIGQSATAAQLGAVDGIATYTRAIKDSEIYRHYLAGRRVLTAESISGLFGGNYYGSESRDLALTKTWTTQQEWGLSKFTDVEFEVGELRPATDIVTGVSKAGEWTGFFEVLTIEATIYGAMLDWDGDGIFTVEASLDNGSTWVDVTNGQTITGTFDWTPTSDMIVRIKFPGGVTEDISEVRGLRARAYSSPTVYGTSLSRTITINASTSTSFVDSEPIDGFSDTGFKTFGNAGVININPDTEVEDSKPIATIEMWHKFNSSVNSKYVFDSRPAGGTAYLWVSGSNFAWAGASAVYINGVAATSGSVPTLQGVWYHIVFVTSSAIATRVDIQNGDRNISAISVYPTALTAADASRMYALYADYISARLVTESNPVSESANAYRTYGYDWAITPAG